MGRPVPRNQIPTGEHGCVAARLHEAQPLNPFTKERKQNCMMANRLDRDEICLIRVLNLQVRLLAEALVSAIHMGQQANRPAQTGRT